MDQTGIGFNLIFAASAEEEISGKQGMEAFRDELPKVDMAIVGEPTKMQMAIAEKGLMVLDICSYGNQDMRRVMRESMPSMRPCQVSSGSGIIDFQKNPVSWEKLK
jgi:hypothetical protein